MLTSLTAGCLAVKRRRELDTEPVEREAIDRGNQVVDVTKDVVETADRARCRLGNRPGLERVETVLLDKGEWRWRPHRPEALTVGGLGHGTSEAPPCRI